MTLAAHVAAQRVQAGGPLAASLRFRTIGGGGGPGCLNMFLHANLPTRWSTQLGERLQM